MNMIHEDTLASISLQQHVNMIHTLIASVQAVRTMSPIIPISLPCAAYEYANLIPGSCLSPRRREGDGDGGRGREETGEGRRREAKGEMVTARICKVGMRYDMIQVYIFSIRSLGHHVLGQMGSEQWVVGRG